MPNPGSAPPSAARVPLRRAGDRVLAGVCAGLAEHLGLPVVWVRGGMLAFVLLGGAGALFYVWLWVTVPSADGDIEDIGEGVKRMRSALTKPMGPARSDPPGRALLRAGPPVQTARSRLQAVSMASVQDVASEGAARARWPVAELLLGGALLIAGVGLILTQLGVRLDLSTLLPGMAVLVGVGLAWWQIADRNRPERHQLPRVLGALGLVAVGVLTFFVTARQPSALTVIAAALAVLAGVALALAPWLLRLNRELIAERSARAREAERAEIAAHLHDSVLQTLAAIQQRSEPGSDVARLARGQERELREWLFRTADGAEPAPQKAVDAELRSHAAMLEARYPVRFEVVSVGAGELVPEPLVAAAREAMLNAAKHAGGQVTAYVEVTADRATVDVTDRGPGLDAERLPEGRMGVRESIVGRMERAGGSARFMPGPGGSGTSVRLALPLEAPQTQARPATQHEGGAE